MKRKGISRKADGAIIKLTSEIISEIIEEQGNCFAYASKAQIRRQKKNLAKADKQFDRILHHNQAKEKHYKNMESLAAQIIQLQIEIKAKTAENEGLKKEANDFTDALTAKVEEIQKTPPFWRFLKYIKVVMELIEVIQQRITLLKTRSAKNT